MEWETDLHDIVTHAQTTPTFEEWMETTGYRDIPETASGLVEMQSIVKTLYVRYRRTFGIKRRYDKA